ncbi:MAG TPA: transposase [Burkholderiales bacterium]|jgi:transposase|nr:transposase [Burkholderiales bacterium]
MATRKYFTKELKLEAVRLLEQSGKSGTELGRQLGVRRNQLYKWQTELRGKAEHAFVHGGLSAQPAAVGGRLNRTAGKEFPRGN